MGFFSGLGKVVKGVVKIAAPVVIAAAVPESMVNTAVGTVVKHGMKKIPNNSIPYLNLVVSSAIAYGRKVAATGEWTGSIVPALTEGGALMAASTALHQSIKLPLKGLITGATAAKVGPGEKFSI